MKEKKRIVIIALGIFFLFSLLIVQYFKIQILEGEHWTKVALSQHELIVKEPYRRGSFFSNTSLKLGHPEKPQPLVFDVTKFHLFIDPLSIPKELKLKIAEKLALFVEGETKSFVQELDKKSRSRKLAMWLDRKVKEEIESWWIPFAKSKKIAKNAIFFMTDYQRCYPFGKLLGQVLHTIRECKDEKTQAALPTGGLEAYFNDYLNGKCGKRKLLRSPLNSLEADLVIEAPENGSDIYLTINHYIQAIAEEEIERGVKAIHAKGGWAVMMDPFTGEILALAQYPFFDPTHYKEYFNDPEKIEYTKVKAITDAFELGSIMKPISLAIGLQANSELQKRGEPCLFDPHAKMDTLRSHFPGRGKPLKDIPRPHKALNMNMALQKSSNVYMAEVIDRVVNRLGNAWYRKELIETFGFGKKTGVELPAEASGLVPTPGKKHPNGALEWSLPTPVSLSIGHNILATSLQMVRSFAILANGGHFVKPTLIKKIVRGDEEKVILDNTNRVLGPQVISRAATKEIVHAMKFATKPGGTGKLADVYGYTEAGKTGTAEKIVDGAYCKGKHISSFIGFAPANLQESQTAQENQKPKPIVPRFVLLVSIDDPEPIILEGGIKAYFGGGCAAPVFREIAARTLEYFGTPMDDPYGFPSGDPRYNGEKADWNRETKELKMLYESWNCAK